MMMSSQALGVKMSTLFVGLILCISTVVVNGITLRQFNGGRPEQHQITTEPNPERQQGDYNTPLQSLAFETDEPERTQTNTKAIENGTQSESLSSVTTDPVGSQTNRSRHVSTPSCSSFVIWTDLGNQTFPRYLKEEVCGQEQCFGMIFRCRPVYYTMRVLTQRFPENQPEDNNVPGPLRADWRFKDVDVSIGCTCGL